MTESGSMSAAKVWLVSLAAVAAAAIGFAGGRLSVDRTAPPPAPVAAAPPQAAVPVETQPPVAADGAVAVEPRSPAPPAPTQAPEAVPLTADTVLATMALSGDFAQTAALYALAARADVAELKHHIDEAKSIGIAVERGAALTILFLRFSELDPAACIDYLYASGLARQHHLIHTIFNGWAKYDPDAAIARVERLRSPADQREAADGIMRAYADADASMLEQLAARLPVDAAQFAPQALATRAQGDPIGALKAAAELKRPELRSQALRWIASIWTRIDPDAALAHAEAIESPQQRREYRNWVLMDFAQRDPRAALARLASFGPAERDQVVGQAVAALARHDPQEALKIVNGLEDASLRSSAFGNLIMGWSSHDPRGAAAALAEMPDAEWRDRYGYSLMSQYAQLAPQEALEWAERIDGHRGNLWVSGVHAIAQNDPGQALTLVAALEPSPFRAELLSTVLGNLATSDPMLAVEFVAELPAGSFRDQTVANIASNWANLDAGAALEWVLEQPPATQQRALSTIAYTIANHDLALAASFTERISGPAQAEWIGAVVQAYTNANPAEAADWIERYKDQSQYGYWVGLVAAGFAARDPRAGAKLIRRLSNPEHYQSAQVHFARRWAMLDPAATAKWWANLPSERQDAQLVATVVEQWNRYDPAAAEKWVLRLPYGDHRDAGIQALIHNRMDVAEVERWIRRISSPAMREQVYAAQAMQLARYDRDAAFELLRRADLAPEHRASLEQMLQQTSSGYF